MTLMGPMFPCLLDSTASFYWTLPQTRGFDYFGFYGEGAGALLLIGMHLSDPMPWKCARRPLWFVHEPGLIDRESKRILGKRQAQVSTPKLAVHPYRPIDPMAMVLSTLRDCGHNMLVESARPDLIKAPGKLLPRRLHARARILMSGESVTLFSRNFSERSQCLHAELTLLIGLNQLLGEQLMAPPFLDELHIYTTLKPCKMCAAFLHIARQRSRIFALYYAQDDPGRLAADTCLDRFGYESSLDK